MTNSKSFDHDVIIIGAGFSGLGALYRLRQAGYDAIVLEGDSSLGGTWRDNNYPGCGCDVHSHLYSFSFYRNPNWSKNYAGWDEIRQYLENFCDDFDLRYFIHFNNKVNRVEYNSDDSCWKISTENNFSLTSKFVVLALGVLKKPFIPEINGLSSFKGKIFHSNTWDHTYDLTGKRVASIGTGASAIQYLPKIVKKVKSLTVLQRSPAWVIPKRNITYHLFFKKLFKSLPITSRFYRYFVYWSYEIRVIPFLYAGMSHFIEKLIKKYIEYEISNDKLVQKLTPNYVLGCKRILLSSSYYNIFNQSHVKLEADPVKSIEGYSLITENGHEYQIDALILGTGFIVDPIKQHEDISVYGMNGLSLKDSWSDGAESYLGMNIAGFPNLFYMTGPNSGLGHNSMIFIIECQLHYLLKSLKIAYKYPNHSMMIKNQYFDEYNADLQGKFKNTVWGSGCNSWYQSDDRKNFVIWPGSTISYWYKTRRVNEQHYIWK